MKLIPPCFSHNLSLIPSKITNKLKFINENNNLYL